MKMGNFLQAVGESNILGTAVQGLQGVAAIQSMENQGQQRALTQMQMNREMFQMKQLEKQEAQLSRKIDITAHPAYLQLPDEVKPQVLKYFSANGFTDPNGVGELRNVQLGLQSIESHKDTFQGFMAPVVEAKKNKFVEEYKKLQDLRAQGLDDKDPKVQKQQAIVNQANMDYSASSGNFQKHIDKLDEIEASKKNTGGKSLQRKTRQTVDEKTRKTYAQDYDYDPGTGMERNVGEPRLVGVPAPEKPEKPEKPEMTTKQAVSDQASTMQALARLGKTGKIDAYIAATVPELAGLADQSDPESLKLAEQALLNKLEYVQQFVPEKLRVTYKKGKAKATAAPIVGGGKDYSKLWK